MDIQVGDVLFMKKPHPCGSSAGIGRCCASGRISSFAAWAAAMRSWARGLNLKKMCAR